MAKQLMSDCACVTRIPRLLIAALIIGALLVEGCAARTMMNNRASDKDPAGGPPTPATDVTAAEPRADVQLGPTDEDEVTQFTLSLVLPGEHEMRAFLNGLYDMRSPDYRQFLDAASFGARFGLPLADVDNVLAWLTNSGFEVVMRPPQRTSLTVRGRVADVNRLFRITLVDWRTPDGVRYHRPQGEPQLPADVSRHVVSVVGLDTEPASRPALAGIYAAGVPHGGLRPEDVRRAYEIEELHAAGIHGEGQTVAIMSFDTFNPDDIAAWDHEMGITSTPVEAVRILGATSTPGAGQDEVSLDIEIIRGIAPSATILNYEAPNLLSNYGLVAAQITADGRAQLVNLSWGQCEKYYPPGVIEANEREYAAAFAAGVSIFAASGDDGAYGCRRVQINDQDPFDRDISPSVTSPSSSPSTISVGGTFLTVREDGTYFEEAGWENPLSGAGGGGGLSEIHPRPSWQQGTGVDNAYSTGMRQLPDIAGPADPSSGFIVISTPPGEPSKLAANGGTSAAAPFWVGSMALTRQLAGQHGINGLGALGPLLYQVAAQRPDVFHDVVKGGNLLHEATAGWDYATGLGTPRVGPLAQAIVDLLTR
jgi:subtilase family serine protease